MKSLDRIDKAFAHFRDTLECPIMSMYDLGYLRHCLEVCVRNGDESTSGHPLFARWALEGHGPMIEPFLIACAAQYRAKKVKR